MPQITMGRPIHSRTLRMSGRGVLLSSLNSSTGRAFDPDPTETTIRGSCLEAKSQGRVTDHFINSRFQELYLLGNTYIKIATKSFK